MALYSLSSLLSLRQGYHDEEYYIVQTPSSLVFGVSILGTTVHFGDSPDIRRVAEGSRWVMGSPNGLSRPCMGSGKFSSTPKLIKEAKNESGKSLVVPFGDV